MVEMSNIVKCCERERSKGQKRNITEIFMRKKTYKSIEEITVEKIAMFTEK